MKTIRAAPPGTAGHALLGGPILAPRASHGTRPVQGRSPYGGYDLSDPTVA